MPDSCAFCGSPQPLTREHVFGNWVSKIGLDLSPVPHRAGSLNGLPRDLGVQPPYRQTVKRFCAPCNNGWMSRLEVVAQRVLTPLILGEAATVNRQDQAAVALWAHKTALTAMLISSKEQRESGYGVAQGEYTALYEQRNLMQPLDASRFWVGRYEGPAGFWAVRVTPLTVHISGLPDPELPQGYAMTIVLGELVLHGLRFTAPSLEVEVTTDLALPLLWPSRETVPWPAGQPCTEVAFLRLAGAKMLQSAVRHVELRPWAHATELPRSTIADGRVRVPALCGKHLLSYPIAVLEDALRGRFHAFVRACECETAYLIQTESDGAHFKAAGAAAGIAEIYEDAPGEELILRDGAGTFACKRLPPGRE